MAYDVALADRIREMIASEPGVSERAMFGGLAFLIDGQMSVTVSGRGGLLVRVGPDECAALLLQPHVGSFIMNGRETRGWLTVDADALEDDADLRMWVGRAVNWAQENPKSA